MAAVREILVRINVDASGANQGAGEASRAMNNAAGSADNLGSKVGAAGKLLGLAVVAGAAVATKSMLSLGMSYEQSLNTLQAVSGSSADKMKEVSEAAKQLGNDIDIPGASAADAASAMTELAKGGLSVDQAMQAAKGTLQLATAAQIDGARAAEIQSAALNTFGLDADQASHVADVLANAANAASGEITDFASGMAQSGLAAKSMGIGVEDTATVLSIFANNGLSGSDAGTSFKTMLISMANPTDKASAALEALGITVYDAQGKFVGMESVTKSLAAAKKDMTAEEFNAAAATAFGTDAMRAAIAMAEAGPDGFGQMSEAIAKTGGAAELAGANTKGLAGALGLVSNAVETASLTLYEQLSPGLEATTRSFAEMIPGIADSLVPALTEAGQGVTSMLTAILPLIPALADALAPAITAVSRVMADIMPFVIDVVGALGDLLGWVSGLPNPVLLAAAAFIAMKVAIGPLTGMFRSVTGGATSFGGAMANIGKSLLKTGGFAVVAAGIGLIIDSFQTSNNLMKDAAGITGDLTSALVANNGVWDDNARKQQVAAVVGSDTFKTLIDAGADYNITLKALTDGGAEGFNALTKNLNDTGAMADLSVISVLNSAAAMNTAGIEAEVAAGKQLDYNASQDISGQVIAAATTQQSSYMSALYDSAKAAQGAGAATDGAAEATDGMGTATATASESLKAMKESASAASDMNEILQISLDRLAGKNISADQAARANAAAMRDIGAAARDLAEANENVTAKTTALSEANAHLNDENKDTRTTTDDVTKAQRELDAANASVAASIDSQSASWEKAAASAQGIVGDTFNATLATGTYEGAVAAATLKMATQRQAFIDSATAAGMSAEAAAALATKQGLIPENVATSYEQSGGEAAARVAQDLLNKANELDGKVVRTTFILTDITKKVFQTQQDSYVSGLTKAAGGYTGGVVGSLMGLPGFVRGGVLPGTPPANPRTDNLLGFVDGGGLFKMRSGEGIVNEPAMKSIGASGLAAINEGRFSGAGLQPRVSYGGGSQSVSVAAPVVQVLLDGQEIAGRYSVMIDGKLAQVANALQGSGART